MPQSTPRELFEKGFINEDQFNKIDLITSGKIVSVFYELRALLYLGVLLFTSGIGILVYQNIGSMGHIIAIAGLFIITSLCFLYCFKTGPAYSHQPVKGPTPYFDYIVLLGSLLFISVQGYLQFQYGLLTEYLGYSTLVTAAFFFFIAYRFDHIGVLSLAITALASFWSIQLSPQKWYSSDFFSSSNLHTTALIFSVVMIAIAMLLDSRGIKKHFTFTYLNFNLLIFFVAGIAGLFLEENYAVHVLLLYAGCAFAYWYAQRSKSFLFLLYLFIAAYITTTFLLEEVGFFDEISLLFFYSIASCGGFIWFIVRFRNYFNRNA